MSHFARYYQEDLEKFFENIVPRGNKSKILILNQHFKGKYDYLLLPNTVAFLDDVQFFAKNLKRHCTNNTRIVVVYFNFLWKPLLELASYLRLKTKDPKEPNWLSSNDIENIFFLEGFEEVKRGKRLLIPANLGIFSLFVNQIIAQLPIINSFCVTTYQIFRPIPKPKEYSVSVIVPARNEEGTIKNILNKIPSMGRATEVIFVEGHSKDNTYEAIKLEIKNNTSNKSASLYKQKGKGKADAVRLGLKKAKNDIAIILDADLTVSPQELLKFYQALAGGKCDFANGSRLVYPSEPLTMRNLNYIGNKIFSVIFTFLLGQKIKDTLCGTKAFFRSDHKKFKIYDELFGSIDPFGDFYFLFSANQLHLKIIDIPVHYKERVYGNTNISRFKHGLMLLKITLIAALKIKFV